MSGALGAAAVASVRNLRISDEKSRKGSSKSKSSRSAAIKKGDISRPVNSSPSPSPPSPTPETLSGPTAPAVPSFRDPYSDSIFSAGDLVAVVWAYQPQTKDEFALERGDMIEIVSIWNDGWATGRLSKDCVDAWEQKHGILIETDLGEMASDTSLERTSTTVVKAFPLVCVCAPRYWRKAVRGEQI
jgi:hypothetical protein